MNRTRDRAQYRPTGEQVSSSAFQQTVIICGAPVSFISPQFAPNQTPVGRGGMLLIPKSDGFSDGQNTFQGVRTYDPQAGVWTTPDAYRGDVHDPMSQKPYMWNGNNPYAFSDPSGYDRVYYIARPAICEGCLVVHLFITVHKDDGTIVRYSFGPKDQKHPLGSKLVRESQDYDRRYEVEHDGDAAEEILGSGTLASCKGTCTKTNGGFDEASLDKSSKEIEKGTYRYGRTNSDTAFHKLCVDGGGGFACDHPNTGRRPAPGLGQPLPK